MMKCPSDSFNSAHYDRGELAGTQGHTYARGNYAYNMGPNRPCFLFKGNCDEGFNSDTSDLIGTASRIWGSGIGGFNVSFQFNDFPEGLSNQVGLDEIRSGISPLDPRGSWALGMVGASITAAHPGGPNHPEYGDGLTSCGMMWLTIGQDAMERMRMPCRTSAIPSNFSATARSLHTGVVNAMRLDGSVEAIGEAVEARVRRLGRDRDAAVATVAGRTTPPTPAEAAAHKAASGEWLLVMAPTITTLPTQVVVDPPTRPVAYVTLYVPLDRLRRPCAWPAVTP